MAKCTGRVPIKGDNGRMLRDDNGKVKTRPCKNPPINGGKVCRQHGGNAPQVKSRAAVRAEVMRWGLGDTTVDPGEMLLRLLTQSGDRAAGYAIELEALVAEAEADGKPMRDALIRQAYGEFGPTGEYVRGLVELEYKERVFCRDTAVKGIAAGLAERQVRLAEKQAEIVIKALDAALDALNIPVGERGPAKLAAAKHLKAV